MAVDELLNYLVTLAVSNSRYQDFDLKSNDFVERALDLMEEQFTGTKQITQKAVDSDENFDLFLFNQIPSQKKSYNKILDVNSFSFEQTLSRDGSKKEFFQPADGALRRNNNDMLEDDDDEPLLNMRKDAIS